MTRGRVALVTGAAGGIGRAIVSALGDSHRLCLLDRDERGLSDLAAGRPAAECLPITVDLREESSLLQAMSTCRAKLGDVDVLVNNAGYGGPFHRIDEVSSDEWRQIFEVNVFAPFVLCRELLPTMATSGRGRIINIASVQGLRGATGSSTYAASKHALVGHTRALAAEWGARGITANAVCPGYVNTAMGIPADATAEERESILSRIPVRRPVEPQEVANLVSYLASDAAASINGATLVIDGGQAALF